MNKLQKDAYLMVFHLIDDWPVGQEDLPFRAGLLHGQNDIDPNFLLSHIDLASLGYPVLQLWGTVKLTIRGEDTRTEA